MDSGRSDAGRDAGRDAGHDAGTPGHDAGGYDAGEPYDAGPADPCVQATGSGASGTSFVDGDLHAEVALANPNSCLRRYVLSSNAPLRDNNPSSPRTVDERNGRPTVRTNNHVFDALYALALDEAREDSVDAIQDGSFNDGSPIACPAGGCFETGRLWHYVWTRDTAYSVSLALGVIDPTRARNSLELKLSERRSGGDLQIVQDTGTGGSYPISSDRVSWAMGAWELLKYLDGTERTAFRDRAFEALKNTVEHDRLVVFDSADGLYSGETSFLDWREQTYPAWTATDVVHIGMSKSLSTNALHLHALQMAAALAAEKGDSAAQARYQGWADGLKSAIATHFWLPDQKLFSTFATTFLDPTPTRRYDLLGEALAVLLGVADETQASQVLASYPHAGKGPPTIWPQQQETPIYHNRSSWPFVTAYWLEAARAARNDRVVSHGVRSLMRGAALNLSNLENFELITGNAYLEEGPTSGPVINSQRQLWSVAGYLAMVQSVVFGLEATQQGIRFQPYVTRELRNDLFAGADTIVLNNLPYRGHVVTAIVKLPARGASTDGAYAVGAVKLNGQSIGTGFVAAEQLPERATFEIELLDTPEQAASMRLVSDTAAWRNVFGPKTPSITSIAIDGDRLAVSIDPGGEASADIAFNVYRDGTQVAADLAGTTTRWIDPASQDLATATHCYAVESYFLASHNTSQHSAPQCFWGRDSARVQSLTAWDFKNTGGTPVVNHGRFHYQDWGAPGHVLEVGYFKPNQSGEHLLQLTYGNGAGPINTGVTCAVKRLRVEELPSGNLVAEGQLFMPHLASWDEWRDSTFLRAQLDATKAYRISIGEDSRSVNMSAFKHFEAYTGGTGGRSGVYNMVNVSNLKVLGLSGSVAAQPAVSFDGSSDFDKLPAANRVAPGIQLETWDNFALAWDEDYLYVAVVSRGFEDATRPYMLYVQASSSAFAAPAARTGMTYDNQTANVPFEAGFVLAVRQTSDAGDGAGPWNGLFRWDGAAWSRQVRFEQGRDFWVSGDLHTLSFRISRAQLGFPTRLRIAGHLVAGSSNYKDVIPSNVGGPEHQPWATGRTQGFYEIDLTGTGAVSGWTQQ